MKLASYLILLSLLFSSTCEKEPKHTILVTPLEINEICELPNLLKEISGLTLFDSKYYGISDSGGKDAIFEISENCAVVSYYITENTNRDWEAITHDASHFYIGDFGNNNGDRLDTKIFKVAIDKLDATDTLNDISTINFHYEDQKTFEASTSNNFDCEAFIIMENEMHLFTKNRGNYRTHRYILNTNEETQTAIRVDSFDTRSLVTDAIYRAERDQLILLSYTISVSSTMEFKSFLHFIEDYSKQGLSSKSWVKVPLEGVYQLESMELRGENELLLGSEAESFGKAKLFSVDITDF